MSYTENPDSFADMDGKYDEHRLPTFDESHAQEALILERQRLMEATKELGRMKLEMEQRIREEMEAKIRAEMEERSKQRKEEDERMALYAERQRAISDEVQKIVGMGGKFGHIDSTAHLISAFFSTFIQTHTVLYIIISDKIYDRGYWPEIIVTSTMIGCIRSIYNPQKNAYPLYFLPMYHFREPLGSSDLMLLNNGMKYCKDITYEMKHFHPSYDIRELSYWSAGNNFDMIPKNLAVLNARQRLQSIIRLIPGEYRNGDWVQLDGFYGMYYHPPTQTFLPHPPPLEE
jgi:hypothetical protein